MTGRAVGGPGSQRLRAAWLLLVVAVAGCTGPAGNAPPAQVAEPAFAPMLVTLTPAEPGEGPGHVSVAWGPQAFGAGSEDAREFPSAAVRFGGEVFTTYARMGWLRSEEGDPNAASVRAQMFAWDLRALLRGAERATRSPERIEASGTLRDGATDIRYQLQLTLEQGRVVAARVEAPGAREDPYTFSPLQGAAPTLTRPVEWMGFAEASAKDSLALERHAVLIGLIGAYARNHAGLLPERVTPEDLRVELLASGQEWPDNAYSGEPLLAAEAHGAFRWARCEPTSGHYVAYGWDGTVSEQRWGSRVCP